MNRIQKSYLLPLKVAVNMISACTMSKPAADSITLVRGLGVEGASKTGMWIAWVSRGRKWTVSHSDPDVVINGRRAGWNGLFVVVLRS